MCVCQLYDSFGVSCYDIFRYCHVLFILSSISNWRHCITSMVNHFIVSKDHFIVHVLLFLDNFYLKNPMKTIRPDCVPIFLRNKMGFHTRKNTKINITLLSLSKEVKSYFLSSMNVNFIFVKIPDNNKVWNMHLFTVTMKSVTVHFEACLIIMILKLDFKTEKIMFL